MLLAYLDESFSKDWYFMAALLCDGQGAQSIGAGLDEVIHKAVAAYDVADDAELHGYQLFQGEGWWHAVKPRARIGVYNQAFQVIADNSADLPPALLVSAHIARDARRPRAQRGLRRVRKPPAS